MTKKEEPKEAQTSYCTGEGKVWLVALLGFLVGLLVMYMAMPALFPAETVLVEEPLTETEVGEEFTLDETKVAEIGQLLADTYLLNTGEDVGVTFTGYEVYPNHIALYYTVMDQEMPLYVSKDYEYLYPSAIGTEQMVADVATAKAQYLEAMANQPDETELAPEPEGYPTSAEPEVFLFLMSNCPYGNQAENGIVDVVSLLEDEIVFEPIYVIYDESIHPSYSAASGECLVNDNVTYCSMHGLYELEQGVREKMVFNRYGEAMWAEYATAVNEVCFTGGQDIETCWKLVADDLGIDTTEIEANYEAEKFTILAREKDLTFSTQTFGSPSLTINGVKYSGSRTPAAFQEAICSAFDVPPEDCTVELAETAEAADGSCG